METVSFISDDIEEIKKEQKKQQAIHSLLPSFMALNCSSSGGGYLRYSQD